MNTETAIKVIKGMIEIEWRRQFPPDLATYYIEALEVAAEALRRQESMKPKVDGEFGLCKTCGYVFNSELISEYCVKYCPYCGQAIDWREE